MTCGFLLLISHHVITLKFAGLGIRQVVAELAGFFLYAYLSRLAE